jgi:hypothetical protein
MTGWTVTMPCRGSATGWGSRPATLTGYRPSYIRKLCEQKRLGYIVQTYFRGHRKRRVRRIPVSELEAMMRKRYVLPVP